MTRKLGCVLTVSVAAIIAWGIFVSGIWKSEDRRFAEAICNPSAGLVVGYSSYQECMIQRFPVGSDVRRLTRYLAGAGFIHWRNVGSKDNPGDDYVLIDDNEKKFRRIRIRFFQHGYSLVSIQMHVGEFVDG